MARAKTAQREKAKHSSTTRSRAESTSGGQGEAATPDTAAVRKKVVLCMRDANALRDALTKSGFEVRNTATVQEATAWLMLYRDSAALVIRLPRIDTFRKAVLREIHRIAPTVPMVCLVDAITPEIQQDLQLARVTKILTIDAPHNQVAEIVERAHLPIDRSLLPR